MVNISSLRSRVRSAINDNGNSRTDQEQARIERAKQEARKEALKKKRQQKVEQAREQEREKVLSDKRGGLGGIIDSIEETAGKIDIDDDGVSLKQELQQNGAVDRELARTTRGLQTQVRTNTNDISSLEKELGAFGGASGSGRSSSSGGGGFGGGFDGGGASPGSAADEENFLKSMGFDPDDGGGL